MSSFAGPSGPAGPRPGGPSGPSPSGPPRPTPSISPETRFCPRSRPHGEHRVNENHPTWTAFTCPGRQRGWFEQAMEDAFGPLNGSPFDHLLPLP